MIHLVIGLSVSPVFLLLVFSQSCLVHEDYIVERTRNACGSGVDIVVDYANTPRSTKRILSVLNQVKYV